MLGLIKPYSTALLRHDLAALAAALLFSPSLFASTVRISNISLSISFSATSLSASIMFRTTTAPRCCNSRFSLRSRACRISNQ
uniref:Uncharacterized protein n=1 Tax=Leptobrachium leishanense TaxID=445787 RepID=A0A8C5M0Z9_9ANUR